MAVKDAKTITYNIEITEKGFVELTSEATKLNQSFSAIGDNSKNFSLALKAITKDVQKNTEAHGRTVNAINAEIKAVEELQNSFAKNNQQYRSAANRIKILQAEKKKLIDTSSKETQQELTLQQQITQLNDGRARTMNVIQQEIALRKQLRSSTATNNEAYLKEELELQRLEREYNDLTKTQSRVVLGNKSMVKGIGNVSSATGTASGAVVELGRTVSDANYGFPAMANNVQQFATQMSFLVKESKGVKGAFISLGQAMTGAGGVLLLISVAISLFERLALNAKNVKEEIKDLNEELAKSKGTIETFEVFAKMLNDSVKGSDEYKLALESLKKEGFDPAKGSVEEFLKVKRAERDLDIEQQGLKEKQLEALTEELRLKTDIQTKEEEINKGFKPKKQVIPIQGGGTTTITMTPEQQKKEAEEALADLRTQFDLNRITVEGVNAQIRDSFLKTTNELKDNPFIDLFLGTKNGKGDVDDKARVKIETALEIIPFDKKLADAQLELLAEHFDIEIGMVKKRNLDLSNLRREDVSDAKLSEQAKLQAVQEAAFVVQDIGFLMQEVFEGNEKLAIAGIIVEKAGAVAGIIANTAMANAKLVGLYPATLGQPFVGINTAAGAASVLATGVAASKAISQIKSKNNDTSAPSLPKPSAPSFNVVGASPQSQLAQTIAEAEQQPTRAYVVAEDVTSAQQLDRETIQGASLG